MNEPRTRATRSVSLLGIVALVAAACGGAATPVPATAPPATVAATPVPATAPPATAAATPVVETAAPATAAESAAAASPSDGAGTPAAGTPGAGTPVPTADVTTTTPPGPAGGTPPFKIGYISLGEFIPFVKLVSDGIKAEATKAGQTLIFCDSNLKLEQSLDCANQMKVQGAQGVLNFQVDQASSPEICTAYGGVPTIAIDIIQPPCQIAFMGADNHAAGKLGGEAIGKYAKDTWNCEYDAYVSLESTAAGAANTARMGGYRDGFTEFCPIKNEKIEDGADRTDSALTMMSDQLTALPGHKIVVVAINEDGILGALAAAKTAGREKDLYYSGQGTDPSIWKDIACNPQYIGSVAYFPERYGTLLIPNMVNYLSGKGIPVNILTPHVVVTSKNIRDVYPATPAC